MTRGSIQEYTEAVRGRYLGAAKKEKGRILEEFTQVTGYHRKAAIRLMRRGNSPRPVNRRGRPRRYGPEVAEALKLSWEATDLELVDSAVHGSTGSPRTLTGSPRTLTGSPRTLTGSPRTLTGSPRTVTGSPRTVMDSLILSGYLSLDNL